MSGDKPDFVFERRMGAQDILSVEESEMKRAILSVIAIAKGHSQEVSRTVCRGRADEIGTMMSVIAFP
jgi:hypothetical protein